MLKILKPPSFSSILDAGGPFTMQIATIMKLRPPPNYDHVKYPEGRRRLVVLEKAKMLEPNLGFIKMPRMLYWMRGPEPVHNRLVYGEFGIQALQGGRLTHRHTESMRMTILRNIDEKRMFAQWRIPSPWQSVTKKGVGIRMGSGKAKVDKHVIPIRPGRIILELGGACELEELEGILNVILSYLPIKARIVSRESMEKEAEEELELEKMNLNTCTFQAAARKNFLGIDKYLSPYDYKWHGKYR